MGIQAMSIDPVAVSADAPHFGHPPTPPPSLTPPPRFEAVDLLRGVVIVLMALDHTRDFFGDATLDPTDLSKVTPALFLTRWVTHFCAPVFAFLAGAGAYLAGIRGRSRAGLAAFLATRGLWLIFLELTVVKFGLLFNPAPRMAILVVFWSIGASFVMLSGLVFLPSRVVGALGVLLIATHNLTDFNSVSTGVLGRLQFLAVPLLRPGLLSLPGGVSVLVGYPLLPWFGVVAAGYGFAEALRLEPARRRSVMLVTGLGLTVAFVALRTWGAYGEPRAWASQQTPILTALSFVNCTKYPPSLMFLLMTLGPAIVALTVFDRVGVRGAIGRALVTLGRVPLFFYISQWYVIHSLAVLAALARGLPVAWLFSATFPPAQPPDWPLSLPGVYAVWVVVLTLLYVPCRWFAGVKQRHRGGWLSYL
jgi:uncharacterized membrane protein